MRDAIIVFLLLGGSAGIAGVALGAAHLLRADRLLAALRLHDGLSSLAGIAALIGAFALLTADIPSSPFVAALLLCAGCVGFAVRPSAQAAPERAADVAADKDQARAA
ncbi:MAG: hypothetical protein SFY69_00760 [Planctomycetota bacterium]|nr:hypothetical protein [Planctomycetota bacterium]